jgi:hypothetical protein
MGAFQDGMEVGGLNPGVAGGGIDVLVAEDRLNVTDVGASLEQMSGAGVPERVRRDGLGDPCCRGMASDELLKSAGT